MRICDLKDYGGRLYTYLKEAEHYNRILCDLDEDLGIDRYLDSQPGGGSCVRDNRKKYSLYSEKLSAITGASVFGELYKEADAYDKCFMDEFFDVSYRFNADDFLSADLFFKCLSEEEAARRPMMLEDAVPLAESIREFSKLMRATYDPDTEDYLFSPTPQLALSVLLIK